MPRSALPKIAYLTGEYPAVSHTFILREVAALRRLGLEIRTCSVRKPGPEHLRGPDEKAEAGGTFYVLQAAKKPSMLFGAMAQAAKKPGLFLATLARAWQLRAPGAKAALYQLFYFVEAVILARHLQAENVDRLHNHFAGPSASVAMLAARLAGIPYSFTLHGPADLAEPARWKLGEKVADADFIATISHYARSQAMLMSAPEHWKKLKIIHCGVNPALYDRGPLPDGPGLHLVFVGRLAPVKGLRVLVEAMGMVETPDARVTIVGDGTERAALERIAAPLGEAVHFTGYKSQEEVAQILANSDAFVLPSFAEGVPVVLMEAMASGRPVIATRITGVPELVEDGVSGILVSPGDVRGLARAIDALAKRADRADMGQAGRAKVLSEFDIDGEAARLAALFLDIGGADLRPEPMADTMAAM